MDNQKGLTQNKPWSTWHHTTVIVRYSDPHCTIKFIARDRIISLTFSFRPRNRKQQPKERQKLQKQKAPLPRLPRAVEEGGRALEAARAEPEAKSEKSSVIF